jgi:DNA-binding transcriptional ArsR family regulator
LYKLLGNATRLKILLALAQGELCVCDVAHVLGPLPWRRRRIN